MHINKKKTSTCNNFRVHCGKDRLGNSTNKAFDWLESRVSLDGLVENSSGPGANSHSRVQLIVPILHLGVTTGRDLVQLTGHMGKTRSYTTRMRIAQRACVLHKKVTYFM